jgi:phage tail sheath protein FI
MPYTVADLDVLARAGIDVICNPAPGGKYFACRNGYNTSSNRAVRGDNYTRMTNYIAKTLANGMGYYVGQLQTPDERRRAKTTLDAFLALLQFTGLIGTADGSPCFKVVLDASNNPQSTVALGYQFPNVQVIYLSVIEFFVISLEGGQTVTITPSGSPQLVA